MVSKEKFEQRQSEGVQVRGHSIHKGPGAGPCLASTVLEKQGGGFSGWSRVNGERGRRQGKEGVGDRSCRALCAMVRIWAVIPKEMGSLEGCEQRVAMCVLGSLLWLSGGFGDSLGGCWPFLFPAPPHSVWTLASFWDPRIGAMPSCISEIQDRRFCLESFLNSTGISNEV